MNNSSTDTLAKECPNTQRPSRNFRSNGRRHTRSGTAAIAQYPTANNNHPQHRAKLGAGPIAVAAKASPYNPLTA